MQTQDIFVSIAVHVTTNPSRRPPSCIYYWRQFWIEKIGSKSIYILCLELRPSWKQLGDDLKNKSSPTICQ